MWAVKWEVGLAGSRSVANTASHLKNVLKPELYWSCIVGCQISKYFGSFCLPEGMADTNPWKGRLVVIVTAVLLAGS